MKYLKRLDLDSIDNTRDLGGIPTADKESTAWHRLFRSANLDEATAKDLEDLKEIGIDILIDLRRDNEIDFDSKSHQNIKENFAYHQVSLSPDKKFRQEEIDQIISKEVSIGESYRNLIDNFPAVKEIMEIIARADGSVIYHCQEGKDRTGIISMILLGLAGVRRGDIIADYEVSSAHLGYIERYEEDEPFSIFRITDPYYMKEAYDYVIETYGTFEDYLKEVGLDDKTIKTLREKLLS